MSGESVKQPLLGGRITPIFPTKIKVQLTFNLQQLTHYKQQQAQTSKSNKRMDNLEALMMRMIETNEKRLDNTEALLRNQWATISNLERQVGQISNLLSERHPGDCLVIQLIIDGNT